MVHKEMGISWMAHRIGNLMDGMLNSLEDLEKSIFGWFLDLKALLKL